MHALGAVMPTSPHSTILGHCTDDADRMCYKDAPGHQASTTSAPRAEEALFDCRKDDYFNASPAPAGYLAGHWNTARSAFLATTDGDDPLSIVGVDDPRGGRRPPNR